MSRKRKVLQGTASNLVRLVLSMLVSLVLPPFLVRRMDPAEYSAWVLILQLSAYVNLLDLGLQTSIGKFVAEFDASGDREASHGLLSTSFSILTGAATIACGAVAVMTWLVPQLFHQMPPALIPEVRIALLAVGLSSAVGLPFNSFASTFVGLQQYLFPTILSAASRVGSAATLILVLLLHGKFVDMAFVMAAFNIAMAATQYVGWRRLAKHRVDFSFLLFDRASAIRLAKYGIVISVWSVSMLLISGLDVVIVGHYQYRDTGFFAVASGPINFMITIVTSAFGPLVPAISSMQAETTPRHLGDLCIKFTRYCTLLLCLMGMPLAIAAFPLLSLWVGKQYAIHSSDYLRILLVGNVVRYLSVPYVLAVMATGKQRHATAATVADACVNVILSVWLVQRIGAMGVAVGTLVGAFVSVGVHLTVSTAYTQATIAFSRRRFVLLGILRPMLVIAPSLLLYPFWRNEDMLPAQPALLTIWMVTTIVIAWRLALTAEDRQEVGTFIHRLV